MVAIGLVFSTLLELSLTGVAGIASPIAFALLAVIGALLLANVDCPTGAGIVTGTLRRFRCKLAVGPG